METFIFDTSMRDNVPVAVCGICANGYGPAVKDTLGKLRGMEFGSYKSGYTIDYRLAELIKGLLMPMEDKIRLVGATAGIKNAECVTGGILGTLADGFESAEEGIIRRDGYMVGTRPGFCAFAAETADRSIAETFEKAAGTEGVLDLYETLTDVGCEFIMISDGSGERACGAAAVKGEIVFLSETDKRAAEQRDFFGLKRIGIMGGTFDPVHNGHLIAAEAVREALGLEKVIFVPTGNTAYKSGRTSSGAHRYKMTCLAAGTNKYFCVSSIETEKEGIAYTVDTVKELREKCDKDAELYFIIGADVLEDITGWKDFDRLAAMCRFAAVTRPGYNGCGFMAVGKLREHGADVCFIEAPALDISSSNIRKAVREGRSVKYLMPESVERFMRLHRLYTDREQKNIIDTILKL